MKVTTTSLKKWIQTSIEICSLLTPEPFKNDIETGRVYLFCPADVFDVLVKKAVLSKLSESFYFEYQGRFGITFVEVRKDQKGRTGLFLEKKADK
jgi:hypothetical protein